MLARLHHGAAGNWNQMHFMGMVSFQGPQTNPQKVRQLSKYQVLTITHRQAATQIFSWVASWQVVTPIVEFIRTRPQALHSSS